MEIEETLHKYLILLAYADDEPIRGRTKLQKIMFLLADKIQDIKDESSYEAYHYGPYSHVIDNELEYLKQIGIFSMGDKIISLTDKGKKIAHQLSKKEDAMIIRDCSEYKKFANDLSSNELLTYVYLQHPDMASKSIVLDKIAPDKERYVFSLIKKEKISSQKAAELLRVSHTDILRKMREQGLLILS